MFLLLVGKPSFRMITIKRESIRSTKQFPQVDWSKSPRFINAPCCREQFVWVDFLPGPKQTPWQQKAAAVLSDELLFTLPPPGLTVSTCEGQDQHKISWCAFTRVADLERRPLEKYGQAMFTSCLGKCPNYQKKRKEKGMDNWDINHFWTRPLSQIPSDPFLQIGAPSFWWGCQW